MTRYSGDQMVKVLDIAGKDLLRSLRNYFFLGLGVGVPVLVGVIFYFAFGSPAGEEGFNLPQTDVLVVNLDEPLAAYGGFSVGELLVNILKSEQLAELLTVREAASVEAARNAVDQQEADVAVIIPAGLTAAAFDPQGRAEIEVYQDPTLTIGPNIVRSIIVRFADVLVGSRIAALVAHTQLAERGVTVDEAVLQDIARRYGEWSSSLAESQWVSALLAIQSPAAGHEKSNRAQAMIGGVMTGMMIFYAFYTGAAAALTILQEEEGGTLSRLFTTPTSMATILSGKLVAVFALVAFQVLVLMALSSLIFQMAWGAPGPILLAIIGLVVLAGGLGVFVMSWLKDTRQAGVVLGGVMTVTGMVGISSVFTATVPGAGGGAMMIVPLFTPQGWAMRAWQLSIEGGGAGDVLPSFAVMLALAVIFFWIGVLRFRKRLGGH